MKTFGRSSYQEASIPKISKKKITIINGGVAASDPFYSYKLLTDRLIKYEPDIVMLAINATDIVDVIGRGGLERFLPDGTVKYMDPPISIYFFKHSHVVRAIMLRLLNYNWYGLGKKDDAVKSVKALKKIEEIICKYEAFLNYRNIKFVTIVHPLYKETLRTEMRTDLTELVSSLIKKNIEVYDLRKYIRGKIPPIKEEVDKYFWPVDTHMNLNGYKLFAEGVEEYLLASEWFLNRINKKNRYY